MIGRLITKLQIPLLILSALATLYAAASFATGFDSDFKVSATIAILCLGATFAIDEHDRARMRRGREAVWERRFEEMER